jgi:hypothetical protein
MANFDDRTAITVEGSVDNTAQASWTDPRACASDPPPLFHWQIDTPQTIHYTAQGITGYRADALTFAADSIPNFFELLVTFTFTVTSQVPNSSGIFFSTSQSFKILYSDSALTEAMSTTCQSMLVTGMGCNIPAALEVLPGTQT